MTTRLVVAWLLFGSCAFGQKAIDADVLLTNARIFDGVRTEPITGAIAIKDDRIVAIGDFKTGTVVWTVDCTRLTVCPGFIDLHNHSDNYVTKRITRTVTNYLTQGCTTIVTGNCGSGPIDVKQYEKKVTGAGVGPNVAHLLPQGDLREAVMGEGAAKASADQIRRMQELADKAMRDGAWGMSTGLIYVPGSFSTTEELIAIAQVVGQHGGLYASHMRNEGKDLLAAVDEAIRIGRGGKLPVHISHFKSSGRDGWGLIREAVNVIEKQRAKGMKITADQYPYIASSTSLRATLLPSLARAGGRSEIVRRFNDPNIGQRVRDAIQRSLDKRDGGSRIQIARHPPRPGYAGKRLSEIARSENKSALDVTAEIVKRGGASIVNFSMQEEDVRFAMQIPWVATASDGRAYVPGGDRPHPRNYGTFTRKLGHYALREKIITEAQAIRSATALPAEILGVKDRGRIAVGCYADLVVYDPKSVLDRATFENPHQHSAGVQHVFVNGKPAVFDGTPTGNRPGRFLKHVSTKKK